MMTRALALILLILCATAYKKEQKCENKPSRVTKLDFFNEEYTFPCMYSGLVQMESDKDQMFYWLFRSPKPIEQTKLLFWFTGIPVSGTVTSLWENGPLKIRPKDRDNVEIYSDIENSFADIANVIYIDQPLGVGYSNSQFNVTTGEQIGKYTFKLLQGIYNEHPELRQSDIIVGGNSFGGHYLPNFVNQILAYNQNATQKDQIKIHGIMLEDTLKGYINGRLNMKDLYIGAGIVTLDILPQYEILEQHCEASVHNSPDTAFSDCKSLSNLMNDTSGHVDIQDIRSVDPQFKEVLSDKYYQRTSVRRQLHLGPEWDHIPYSSSNYTVYANMRYVAIEDYSQMYSHYLDLGIKIIAFDGNFDALCSLTGTQRWMKLLNLTTNDEHRESTRQTYYMKDTDGTEKVAGNFISYDDGHRSFSYVVVYNGNHVLGVTQFKPTKSLLGDMIATGKARCNSSKNNCNTDSNVCSFMNNCFGNGKCAKGVCSCNKGFFGADCSIQPTELKSGDLSFYPREWKYFIVKGSSHDVVAQILSQSGSELLVYHKESTAPSRSDYDGYKQGSKFNYIIDAISFDTIVAIHNPSLNSSVNITVHLGEMIFNTDQ